MRLNQAWIIHIQAVTIGVTNYTRRPVAANHRLVVKPTRSPVIVARIYIRQWIRSCTKATSGEKESWHCHTTQGAPEALIMGVRLNQASTIHTQAVTSGASINTRRPVVAIHRLVVKHARTPVIEARIDIRQWIASSIPTPTLIILIPIGSE